MILRNSWQDDWYRKIKENYPKFDLSPTPTWEEAGENIVAEDLAVLKNTSPICDDDDEERVEIELIKTFCDTSRQSECQTPRVSFLSGHYWWLWPRVLILFRGPLLMKKKGGDWTFCDTSRPWPRVVILVRYPFPRCSHRSDSLRQKRQVGDRFWRYQS